MKIEYLGVDARMISMIPVKLLKKKDWGESKKFGTIIKFTGSLETIKVNNGDFKYGIYSIKTS